MPSAANVAIVNNLTKDFKLASAIYVLDYKGMSTDELNRLRQILGTSACKVKVVKNTLASKALKDAGINGLDKYFEGQTAIAIEQAQQGKNGEASSRSLTEFAKNNKNKENFKIKGGMLGSMVLTDKDISDLAKLPSRNVLIGNFVCALRSQLTVFLMQMTSPMRSLVNVLEALKNKNKSSTSEGGN